MRFYPLLSPALPQISDLWGTPFWDPFWLLPRGILRIAGSGRFPTTRFYPPSISAMCQRRGVKARGIQVIPGKNSAPSGEGEHVAVGLCPAPAPEHLCAGEMPSDEKTSEYRFFALKCHAASGGPRIRLIP